MEQVIDKYNCTLSHLDFWMIELMIITYIYSKKLHSEIYKHQKLVLYFNLIPIIFKVGTIIFVFKEEGQKIIYTIYPILIPIGIIIYIPFMFVKSYVNVIIKYFMDSKYFSANKILQLYGLIGTIFFTIICIISTFFKCKDIDEDNQNFYDNICSIKHDKKLYFENFFAFIETETCAKEIILEVLAVIVGMISFYFYKFYSMMIIKYLSPVHITFLTPIYYFLVKVIVIIYNLILFDSEHFLKDSSIKYIKENFFLDVSGDLFCLFGFLVYLEIIELNCLDLSYNSRKKIDERGRIESFALSSEDGDIILNNFDDEDKDSDKDEDVNKDEGIDKDENIDKSKLCK